MNFSISARIFVSPAVEIYGKTENSAAIAKNYFLNVTSW